MSSFTYRIISFLSIFYVLILSILQVLNEARVFSYLHVICCLALLISFKYSSKYYIIILKVWCSLLFISGILILLSSILYLISGNGNKISYTGNLLALFFVLLAAVLFKNRNLFYNPDGRSLWLRSNTSRICNSFFTKASQQQVRSCEAFLTHLSSFS